MHEDGWERVTSALVKEISLLSPGVEPSEPRACVLSFRPMEEPTASREGEVFFGGETIRRDFPATLTVR